MSHESLDEETKRILAEVDSNESKEKPKAKTKIVIDEDGVSETIPDDYETPENFDEHTDVGDLDDW